jgi:hypothetical protein
MTRLPFSRAARRPSPEAPRSSEDARYHARAVATLFAENLAGPDELRQALADLDTSAPFPAPSPAPGNDTGAAPSRSAAPEQAALHALTPGPGWQWSDALFLGFLLTLGIQTAPLFDRLFRTTPAVEAPAPVRSAPAPEPARVSFDGHRRTVRASFDPTVSAPTATVLIESPELAFGLNQSRESRTSDRPEFVLLASDLPTSPRCVDAPVRFAFQDANGVTLSLTLEKGPIPAAAVARILDASHLSVEHCGLALPLSRDDAAALEAWRELVPPGALPAR